MSTYERMHSSVVSKLREASEADLSKTMNFLLGPGKFGDIPKIDFLWFVFCDHIHHRGQLSVYLRMAGGKVPSIYGPSADETWVVQRLSVTLKTECQDAASI